MKKLLLSSFFFLLIVTLSAQNIVLPSPTRTGGMPLMEALSKRSTCRDFTAHELDNQMISNMLWAAFGFNREDKRTAPSAQNKQEISLYLVMKSGVYLYDAKPNVLVQISKFDMRKFMGNQPFVPYVPINIIYVADRSKNGESRINTGCIIQNVYLFCASEGLCTVSRNYFDEDVISKALKLKVNQEPIMAQSVGKRDTRFRR